MKKFKSDDNRIFFINNQVCSRREEETKTSRETQQERLVSHHPAKQSNDHCNFTADRIQLANNERPAAAATTVVAE